MKKFSSQLALVALFSGLVTFSAVGQTAPAKSIGPATPNTKQGKIIDSALSAKTRQTLKDAMDSASTADLSGPATAK